METFFSQDLRTQLLQERESVRHISLQKDIELKELQARIDKNVGVLVLIYALKLILLARHKSSRRHARRLWKPRQAKGIWKRKLRI